jgi:hypothetical protein
MLGALWKKTATNIFCSAAQLPNLVARILLIFGSLSWVLLLNLAWSISSSEPSGLLLTLLNRGLFLWLPCLALLSRRCRPPFLDMAPGSFVLPVRLYPLCLHFCVLGSCRACFLGWVPPLMQRCLLVTECLLLASCVDVCIL